MKILKIEFKNINSLRGKHEIDFTSGPFRASSLFAITGPTGSGKSTILDVISLALFNKIPRLSKVSKNEIEQTGAILTRNQKEAYAKVTYLTPSGKFSSVWSISTNRNGNLRDHEMDIFNADTGDLIESKKSEVPGKNEKLIGLNYNQFIKSVVLAQGEFAQFLKASKGERGELLEKITGTGIYRQLGSKVYEKNKLVNQDIQREQQECEIIEKQLLSEEELKQTKTDLKEKETSEKLLEKEKESLSKSLELKKNIKVQSAKIHELEEESSKAEKLLKEFEDENGEALKQHEKVQPFSDELRKHQQLIETRDELIKELETAGKNREQNSKQQQELIEKVSGFIRKDIHSENLENELQQFVNKVTSLQEQRKEKGNEYAQIRTQLKAELRDSNFQLNEHNLEAGIAELKQLSTASWERFEDLSNKLSHFELENATEEKQKLQKKLSLAREALQESEKLNTLSEELDKRTQEEAEIRKKSESLPELIEKTGNKLSHSKKDLDNLELKKQNQMLRASLEEHRMNLKDGEACPLCGSIHHPFAEDLPEKDDSLENQIKKKQKEYELLNEQYTSAKTNLKHQQDRLEELKKATSELKNKETTGRKAFNEKYGKLYETGETPDWRSLCSRWEQEVTGLETFEKQKNSLKALNSGIPLMEKLFGLMQEGKKISEQLSSVYKGQGIHQDSRMLQNSWNRLTTEAKTISEREKELQDKTKSRKEEISKLEAETLPKIREQGFEDLKAASAALMPDARYNTLRTQRETFRRQIENHQASIKLLSSQLGELKKQDSEKTKEEVEELLDAKLKEFNSIKSACEELRRKLNNHNENLQRLENIRLGIAAKEKQTRRWRLLNELIGDSQGKKFNEFAQDLTLGQLLILANKRLQSLSDRYKIDKPAEDEDDGLVAIDEHMGGQRRSVKTLSGGETFILSLSMALALSDLASKNVEINSLFIDEGFGTLDPETLDQTLDTLEKLQAESSKMIGIISHVDSLKERIATQIRLQRNGQGYSQLEVKG
ncbi:SbcC/MukB-like Walker B domain-containing protein [Salegentibacter chungangensis]|uniref:SbcC/MukB-like Walker B domain-containing protein n=1 Tax=Salegentibacter chungangensis TaxID=1335724 RepID=A0ABW3NWR0_9FLAO